MNYHIKGIFFIFNTNKIIPSSDLPDHHSEILTSMRLEKNKSTPSDGGIGVRVPLKYIDIAISSFSAGFH